MTADDFRRLALTLPEAVEEEHMGHRDFRVRGEIFATLANPNEGRAIINLDLGQRDALVRAMFEVFTRVSGGCGRTGATHVALADAVPDTVQDALAMARCNAAPRRLVARHQEPATEP